MTNNKFDAVKEKESLNLNQKIIPTVFGDMIELNLPDGASSVIIAYNSGGGLRLLEHVMLPHQIYVKKLEELKQKHPNIKQFVIIPIRSNEYIKLNEWGKL